MNSPFIRAEEAERKGFDFSPWGGLEGFLKASQAGGQGNAAALKRLVPDLAHAVDMTATAISSLPFEIVPYETAQPKKGKDQQPAQPAKEEVEVFDSSKDWQNKLGGMPNPKRLIYLIASSLCGGKAYVIPRRTPRAIFDLQYAAPHTIQPQINHDGLQYFDRASDQGKTETFKPEELLYFWLPDSDVELGPALNHPLGNAQLDAQLVMAMKSTLKQYGDRGFVPITLLGAKGMPSGDERVKAEGFFDRLLKGGFNVLAKIVNADALELIRVGAGMEELKQSYLEIRRDAKESIADSFGIPPSMFMSDKAYASEMDILMRQWYSDSRFVSIYETIEGTLTEQLFKPYGYKMRFLLETLDIFQEDENAKSVSLGQIVTAVSTDPAVAKWAMSVLGYEMTKEQEGELEKLVAQKEEEKAKEEQLQRDQMQQDADLQREAIAAKPKPAMPAKSVKREFSSYEEQQAAFAQMAEDGTLQSGGDKDYALSQITFLRDKIEANSDGRWTSEIRYDINDQIRNWQLIKQGKEYQSDKQGARDAQRVVNGLQELQKEYGNDEVPSMVSNARREYDFQLTAYESGKYPDGSPIDKRTVSRNLRRAKQRLLQIAEDYRADGYRIPNSITDVKAIDDLPPLTADDIKDISLWYSKALAWFPQGKSAVDWENKHLSEDVAAPIRLKLASAKSVEDITQAFTLDAQTTQTPAPVYEDSVKALALQIEKAIETTNKEK